MEPHLPPHQPRIQADCSDGVRDDPGYALALQWASAMLRAAAYVIQSTVLRCIFIERLYDQQHYPRELGDFHHHHHTGRRFHGQSGTRCTVEPTGTGESDCPLARNASPPRFQATAAAYIGRSR